MSIVRTSHFLLARTGTITRRHTSLPNTMLRLSAGILDTNWSRGRASTTSSAGGFGKIGTGCAAGIDGAAAAGAFFAAFFAAVFTAVFAAEPASSPGFQGCVR